MVAPLVTKTGKILDLINLREVEADCLCLRTTKANEREYKAVIKTDPVNFSLMSEGEQEAILEGFRVLLTRISPDEQISVHVRTLPYNLQPYIEKLQYAREHNDSLLFQEMAHDHENYVLQLASQRALLQREFYIRIGAQIDSSKKLKPSERFERAKSTLDLRCQDLLEDLQRAGLTARRLDSEELVAYYLSCIHSHHAEAYPVARNTVYAVDFVPEAVFKTSSSVSSAALPTSSRQTIPLDPTIIESKDPSSPSESSSSSTTTSKRWIWKEKKTLEAARQKEEKQRQKDPKMEYTELVSLPELIQPSLIEQYPHYIKIHHEIDEYFRGRAVIGYPAYVVAGWLDRLLQIDEPYIDVVLYIETLNPTGYTNRLTRKLTGFKSTLMLDVRHGRTENPYIKEAKQQVEELRDKIVQQTEKVHGVSLYICSRASSRQELKERDSKVVSLLRSLDLASVELSLEHLQAWLCCLPDARDVLKRRKVLDTSSVVTAFPFASSSLSTEPGSLVGVMPNGSLVIMNPSSDQLENGHEVTFARSGAGKSYYHKVSIGRSLLMGYECIVIDPEDEYLAICQRFRGTNIRLSPGALQLNPFDLTSVKGERNILEEKFQSLLVLFDLLLADKDPGTLSQKEKGYLNKIFTRAYANCGISSDTATHNRRPPNMQEVYELITSGDCGSDVYDLGDRLARYLPSFPTETQVELDNPLVVFNIRDLPDELKPAGLYLVTEFVWTQVRKEHAPRPRILTIDEAWTLLQFPEGGRFLSGLSRRARKYNLCLRVITQDVEDFLASEWGRTILLNSAMKFLMKQDSTTIDAVTKAFKLSDEERKFLLACAKGEGLFFARASHVPLRVVASEVEHKLATTNPQELLQEELKRLAQEQQDAEARQHEAVAIENRRNEYNIVFPRIYAAHAKTTNGVTEPYE